MYTQDYAGIKHDFRNSVTSIKGLSKASINFIDKVCEILLDNPSISKKHLDLFKQSMKIIEDEANKLEELFFSVANQDSINS